MPEEPETLGRCILILKPDNNVKKLLSLDCRFEIWRTIGAHAPYLDGETIFFLRKWGYTPQGSSGADVFRMVGHDPISLLDNRNNAYPAADFRLCFIFNAL